MSLNFITQRLENALLSSSRYQIESNLFHFFCLSRLNKKLDLNADLVSLLAQYNPVDWTLDLVDQW